MITGQTTDLLVTRLRAALGTHLSSVWYRDTEYGDEVWLVVCGEYEKDVQKAWAEVAPFLASRKIDGFKVVEKRWLTEGVNLPDGLHCLTPARPGDNEG